MKKLLKMTALSAAALVAMTPEAAFAQDSAGVFDSAATKATEAFTQVKRIVFILGGFGLVGLGGAAIFGKLNWKWFGALAVGLAIVAAAGGIVDFATEGGLTKSDGNLNDSFGNNN